MDRKQHVGDNEEGKPRRLEEETMHYLLQLDPQLDSTDEAEVEILVENVLDEIKNRSASAACDRYVNSVIEKICLSASFKHIIELIQRFTQYSLFLARNRHSSHVLQVLF